MTSEAVMMRHWRTRRISTGMARRTTSVATAKVAMMKPMVIALSPMRVL